MTVNIENIIARAIELRTLAVNQTRARLTELQTGMEHANTDELKAAQQNAIDTAQEAVDRLEAESVALQALIDERDYWRQTAACHIQSARIDIKLMQESKRGVDRPQDRLREHVISLEHALAGEFFEICGACDAPVRQARRTRNP